MPRGCDRVLFELCLPRGFFISVAGNECGQCYMIYVKEDKVLPPRRVRLYRASC